MVLRVDNLLGIALGLGIHTRLIERITGHVQCHTGQHTPSRRLAYTTRGLERLGCSQVLDSSLHIGNHSQIGITRIGLRNLHRLDIAIRSRMKHERNVTEAYQQHEVVETTQELRLGIDIIARLLLQFGLVDALHQHIGSVDTLVEVTPIFLYLRITGLCIVVAHRVVVRRVTLIADVGRQTHTGQHLTTIELGVGHHGIDTVQSKLHLLLGRIKIVGRMRIHGFGFEQRTRTTQQHHTE